MSQIYDFLQKPEAARGVRRCEALERTSIKRLRQPGEWGGGEALERTSIKDLRLLGEWEVQRPQRRLPSQV